MFKSAETRTRHQISSDIYVLLPLNAIDICAAGPGSYGCPLWRRHVELNEHLYCKREPKCLHSGETILISTAHLGRITRIPTYSHCEGGFVNDSPAASGQGGFLVLWAYRFLEFLDAIVTLWLRQFLLTQVPSPTASLSSALKQAPVIPHFALRGFCPQPPDLDLLSKKT